MNSYQRVISVIEGTTPDKLPNLNIIMQFAAREIGVSYREYSTDYRNIVRGNLACAEKYGIDCVTVMQGPMSEAHDLGAKVIFPEDGVPYSPEPLIRSHADVKALSPVGIPEGGTMENIVRAVERYASQVKGELSIIGWVEGCFAEAADLTGVTEFLTLLADADEEGFIRDLLDLVLDQAVIFAKAQIAAGADIIGIGDAIASVAGPVCYRKLAREYEEKLLSAIRAAGAKTKLHICGNIAPFLADIPAEYCDIVDVDWMVPLAETAHVFGGRCAISGNYNPVSVLLYGSTADVDAAVRECASIAGLKHFTAAGCEVPRHTPSENLMQVKHTVDSL
jgi:uroporphyrinogen decarboxylase